MQAPTTETFNFTGSAQTWTVPAGVTSVDVVVKGAQGGDTAFVIFGIPGAPPGGIPGTRLGAKGGSTSATLTVTPGDTLHIFVGGKGGTATSGSVGAGGFNGGGDSGSSVYGPNSFAFFAGGGGGASDIRIGGTALSNRVVVAGGGGGHGDGTPSTQPGTGGLLGGEGSEGADTDGGEPGGGGTSSAGGAGGLGAAAESGGSTCIAGEDGTHGALGAGGTGGDAGGVFGGGAPNNHPAGGGGGGGGFYGGGGACDQNLDSGGGGGGSSCVNFSLTTNADYESGDRSGGGIVTITYPSANPTSTDTESNNCEVTDPPPVDPPAGPTFDGFDYTLPTTVPNDLPNTGEPADRLIGVALLFVACGTSISLVFSRRRRRKFATS